MNRLFDQDGADRRDLAELLPSQNSVQSLIGSGAAGQTIILMPLFGALLAVLLLGEQFEGYHTVAMVLILVGVAAAAFSSMRAPQDKARSAGR